VPGVEVGEVGPKPGSPPGSPEPGLRYVVQPNAARVAARAIAASLPAVPLVLEIVIAIVGIKPPVVTTIQSNSSAANHGSYLTENE
jgi:hypothetical protein